MASPVLSVAGLRISFAGTPRLTAVSNVSFSLMPGKTLAVVGESGSGKSLTALALLGLLPANAEAAGEIRLQQVAGGAITRGKEIAMIFQEPASALNPIMKIGKQLSECIRLHQRITRKKAKAAAVEWLRRVRLPEPEMMYDRFPHQLSGGQKQRVLIAMAMCNNPAVLIADEPTTSLDVTVQQEIIRLMRELQAASGTAMIFITHDLSLAAAIADDVLVMYRGEAAEYGPVQDVLHHPRHPYTRVLLLCRPSAQQKGKRLPVVQEFLEPAAVTGNKRQATELQPAPAPPGATILEAGNLDVWFTTGKDWLGRSTAWYQAVHGVSFSVRRGEVLGIAGESGSGKSTLSRSLMGLIPITGGSARFGGYELERADRRAWMHIRRKMQLVFQDPFASLNPRLTIGQILTEPLHVHHIVPQAGLRKEVLRLLDLVQLPASAYGKYPHQFSGGQKQRIGIARALALQPELLICDESVSALDVSIQAQILNLLKDLQQAFGLTYLFISHDLSVIHYISDRIMIMQAGAVVEQGTADEVFTRPQHPYTRQLLAAMPERLQV